MGVAGLLTGSLVAVGVYKVVQKYQDSKKKKIE